jgi:hypothetical protein
MQHPNATVASRSPLGASLALRLGGAACAAGALWLLVLWVIGS